MPIGRQDFVDTDFNPGFEGHEQELYVCHPSPSRSPRISRLNSACLPSSKSGSCRRIGRDQNPKSPVVECQCKTLFT